MNMLIRVFVVSLSICGSAEAGALIPQWLQKHVGDSADHISSVVLRRARDHFFEKRLLGQTTNPCYIAMDATRRHQIAEDEPANRGYLICESKRLFIPFSVDHGGGIDLPGLPLSNDKTCAKNFGNAMNSRLTMGGGYLSVQVNQTFKGELKNKDGSYSPFFRPFLVLSGEGDTSDALDREIGLHPAVLLSQGCYRHEPSNPQADPDGDIYYADQSVTYYDGRTEGCLGVREEVAQLIMAGSAEPLPIYVYPESSDIKKVARAVADGVSIDSAGVYWNKECLAMIKSPNFWDRETYDKPIQDALNKIPPAPKVMCPKLTQMTEEFY